MPSELSLLPAWLVDCTLQGSFAIALVIAVVPLVRRFLGARVAYLLWAIVILRLLVPWLPATPLHWGAPSIRAEAAPRTLLKPGMEVTATVTPGREAMPAAAIVERPETPAPHSPSEEKSPPGGRWSWQEIAPAVWLTGVALGFGLALLRGIRAARLVRRASTISADPLLADWVALPGAARVRIKETGELRSPALTGVIHPTILLPLDWRQKLPAAQLRCVLAHELGHFHRGDLVWRWAFLVARTVHWFNPLVWLADHLARIDQEMACDEWVLGRERTSDARLYGEALLASAQKLCPSGFSSPVQVGMAESRAGLRRRVRHLLEIRPHGRRATVAGILLAGSLLVLTGPARSEAPEKKKNAEAPAAASTPRYTAKVELGPEPTPTPRRAPLKVETQVQIESKFVELPAEMARELLKIADSKSSDAPADISAVYAPREFQTLIRNLNQKKGVDLMSAPTVTTKAGNKCVINVIREFRYPTQFEQSSDGKGTVTPTAFATRNLGVTLEAEPTIMPSGEIDLELAPEVTYFEGFVNFGGSRAAKANLEGDATADAFEPTATHVINQPVFSTRRIHTSVTMHDGETIALGGLTRDDVQRVTDNTTGKRLPDVHVQRALYIFVTAKLIDPKGQPLHSSVPSAPKPAAPSTADGNQFYGVAAPGKPGFVTSPYAPGAGYVDVRGFPINTEVKDPYTGQMFLVPSPDGARPPEPSPAPDTPLGKALRIIIPEVKFQDADLSSALNTLGHRGAELDAEGEPSKRGVNLVLKLTEPSKPTRKITAKLTNISLFEAVRFVAATNDLVVAGEPYALSLQPTALAPLITRTYRVPTPFLSALQATKPSDMKSFWRAHGIDFAPGASVNFRAPAELALRNSREEHEKLQKLFSPTPAYPVAR